MRGYFLIFKTMEKNAKTLKIAKSYLVYKLAVKYRVETETRLQTKSIRHLFARLNVVLELILPLCSSKLCIFKRV